MSYKSQSPKNLQSGDDGDLIYWRVMWALKEDPLASMLSVRVLEGLSRAVMEELVDDEGKASISPEKVRLHVRAMFYDSPLAVFGQGPINHLVKVIRSAIFPDPSSLSSSDFSSNLPRTERDIT